MEKILWFPNLGRQKFIDNIKFTNPSINFRSKGQIEIEEF